MKTGILEAMKGTRLDVTARSFNRILGLHLRIFGDGEIKGINRSLDYKKDICATVKIGIQ